ncbi:hypothetical protein B0T11DRAFT_67557 [Plectosphaerella cucumerina]|uniref:Uncharacterized protein n=1 Tax=Plectosphaerella cucumerina TaxID=40658 RepID=A0A8K0X7N8_9PEZI|nr:hypothetical protein B0T11DRAFT_67557 [Plectosphaerella cucumerina]
MFPRPRLSGAFVSVTLRYAVFYLLSSSKGDPTIGIFISNKPSHPVEPTNHSSRSASLYVTRLCGRSVLTCTMGRTALWISKFREPQLPYKE